MKLTRITKIRHRVFRDFARPNDLHTFAQFNVIYGWNGCGKTTLSSLLSLIEKKVALTEGEAEFEFDGFQFFRLVKNWFHQLPKQQSPHAERRPGRFFLLRPRRHSDGSRTSYLGPLDPLLQEHESEYQYLFKRIHDEAHRTDVATLEHHYGLPNIARRLIEAFLAFRFPEMSGDLVPRLDRVTFDDAKKTRILRLLNTYSHAGAISDPEHDLSLLAETQPVLLDVLELMKAVDREHYEELEKLVGPSDGPPSAELSVTHAQHAPSEVA